MPVRKPFCLDRHASECSIARMMKTLQSDFEHHFLSRYMGNYFMASRVYVIIKLKKLNKIKTYKTLISSVEFLKMILKSCGLILSFLRGRVQPTPCHVTSTRPKIQSSIRSTINSFFFSPSFSQSTRSFFSPSFSQSTHSSFPLAFPTINSLFFSPSFFPSHRVTRMTVNFKCQTDITNTNPFFTNYLHVYLNGVARNFPPNDKYNKSDVDTQLSNQ